MIGRQAEHVSELFGTSAQLWLKLQTRYERDLAEDRAAEQIAAITPLNAA